MDLHPTPYPGKNQTLKSRTNPKSSEAPKTKVKEPLMPRGKRVFGVVRNPNIPAKTVTEKPKTTKPSSGIPQKPTKPSSNALETPIKSSEKNVARAKKTVNFLEKVDENKEKMLQESIFPGPQTPLRSPFLVKPRALGTPYHSADRCSKCRFDKLETSSYWLAQIKLAESVGKHFVSADFFRLAFECTAEPLRNIKIELKKYLARHEYLSVEKGWKDLSLIYGLPKDESSVCPEKGEEGITEDTNEIRELEDNNTMEQVAELVNEEADS